MSGRQARIHGSGERVLRHAVACALVRFRHERRGGHGCGVPVCFFPAVLAFGREFLLSVRRHPGRAGFSPATRRLAMKWFRRGVSGRLLWLVAEALLAGRRDDYEAG